MHMGALIPWFNSAVFIHIHVVNSTFWHSVSHSSWGGGQERSYVGMSFFLVDSVKTVQVFPLILRGEKSVGIHSQGVTF